MKDTPSVVTMANPVAEVVALADLAVLRVPECAWCMLEEPDENVLELKGQYEEDSE